MKPYLFIKNVKYKKLDGYDYNSKFIYWKPDNEAGKSLGKERATFELINLYILSKQQDRKVIKTVIEIWGKKNLLEFLNQSIDYIREVVENLKQHVIPSSPEIEKEIEDLMSSQKPPTNEF